MTSILNRNALRIQSTASKVSAVLSSLLRGARIAVRLAGLLLVAAFVGQWSATMGFDSESLSIDDALRSFPRLGLIDWFAAFSLFLLVDVTMTEVVRKLGEKESGR